MVRTHRGKTAATALLCLMICALLPGCKTTVPEPQHILPMQVSLLRVGKADAIVLQAGEETLVIDAGEEEDGEELVTFLTNQGIQRVDTLIITHFDRDHVGGADTVVEELEIGQVFLPAYEGSSTEYLDFMEALKEKSILPKNLTEPVEFTFGDASVLVEPPLSYEVPGKLAEIDNNFSLITTVVHGEKRFIFAGDAEKQRIRHWLEEGTVAPCDFLKMPHHGVY
ncbi:MAG: MBL fold metallo-hydrolase, partial [Pseudoflavonifractor sp.]